MTTDLNIRPFDESDADYDATTAIYNLCWPDFGTTSEQSRHEDATWPERFFIARYMVEQGGKVVAYGAAMEPSWSYKPGKYRFTLNVHPDHRRQGVGQALYAHLRGVIADRDPAPVTIVFETRENHHGAQAMLKKLGAQQVMRYPISELDVPAFDPTPFAPVVQRVADSGIAIRSLAELWASDPDWLPRLHAMDWDIWRDVPSVDPPQKLTVEEFGKELEAPNLLPEAYFIAVDTTVDGGRYVATSQLYRSLSNPHKLETGLTGTLSDYRRRGLALALKLRAIDFAKAYGATTIDTDNEENNPMYQINLKLGFKPVPAWAEYELPY